MVASIANPGARRYAYRVLPWGERAGFVVAQVLLLILVAVLNPNPSSTLSQIFTVAVRLIAIACLVRGVIFYKPQLRVLWLLLIARFVWSVIYGPIHGSMHFDLRWLYCDAIAGTLVYIIAAGILVQHRTARQDRTSWLDVATISLGFSFIVVTFITIPVAINKPLGMNSGLLGFGLSLFDVALVSLLLFLFFTSLKDRNVSLALLLAGFLLDVVSDLSLLATELGLFRMSPSRSWGLATFAFIALIGLAAIPPSMQVIDRDRGASSKSWGVTRSSLIMMAFLFTLYRLVVHPMGASPTAKILAAVALTAMFLLIVARVLVAIRDLASAYSHIAYMASHDHATALMNMEGVSQQYQEADVASWLVMVRLCELDSVGQLWGHVVRDRLILDAAERMRSAVEPAHLLARIAVDQFVALPRPGETSGKTGCVLAQEIAKSIQQAGFIQGTDVRPVFAIGIAENSGFLPLEELLRDAESAMQVAEGLGINRIEKYNAELAAAEKRRFALVNLLRSAVERNEFSLVYQPVVELGSRRVWYTEALLRWRTPEWGDVSPSEFIPLAESTDLIESITDWVVETVCRTISSEPRAEGEGYLVAVNISPHSLIKPGLADRVLGTCARYGVAPSMLCLEITERSLLDDAHGELGRLRENGVLIIIDDFGIGYSNLKVLTQMRADVVKLDMSLVQAVVSESDSSVSLVRQIIPFLRAQKAKILAEGVETEEQHEQMVELGCDFGQGWLYARPEREPQGKGVGLVLGDPVRSGK